jgi:hypothetical protein
VQTFSQTGSDIPADSLVAFLVVGGVLDQGNKLKRLEVQVWFFGSLPGVSDRF